MHYHNPPYLTSASYLSLKKPFDNLFSSNCDFNILITLLYHWLNLWYWLYQKKNILFAHTQKLYSNCSNTVFLQNKLLPPRLWNTGLVSSRASLTLWGEGASLALVGHPSSDGVMIKMPYPLRTWNTGLVSSEAGLASWGEGSSLALVGHPSGDCITIKMP